MSTYSPSPDELNYQVLLAKLDELNGKIGKFVNGGADETVTTTAGAIRTLAGIEKQALVNRWVQRIIDIKTVAEIEANLVTWQDGQMFRVWKQPVTAVLRNGIYQKDGDRVVRVNVNELSDVLNDDTDAKTETITNRIVTNSVEVAPFPTIVVSDNYTYGFTGQLTARSGDESAFFMVEGCIKRGLGESTVAFVGTPIVRTIGRDVAAWELGVALDPVLGGLVFHVKGEDAKTISWFLKIDTVSTRG